MLRIISLCVCVLSCMPSCVEKVAAQLTTVSAIPVLKVWDDTSQVALQIAKLHVDIKITGNIATTVFDVTYYNNTDKVLEGEFDFPLADGQSIFRYALDINGVLREGVVVEKVKARVAYESTVRRKVDPGLVEKTKGNSFRTRIYPIPAKGYKRVLIGVEQTLVSVKEGLLYRLPLASDQIVKEFKTDATVFKYSGTPALLFNTLTGFDFGKHSGEWKARYTGTDVTLNNSIEILLLENKADQFFTEKYGGQTYFYAHLPGGLVYEDKKNPSTLTLLWDVSASAERRNVKKELELLKRYLERLNNVTVNLVPFNITTLVRERFVISGGDAADLLKRLESFSFDGGTQLGSIDLTEVRDEEILLFSDGLSTFGKKEILLSGVPVTTVSSAAVADYGYLKLIALQTHGRFINLSEASIEQALERITKEPLQFIKATFNTLGISGFSTQVDPQLHNGFSFAGILQNSPASVTLHFGYGSKIAASNTILIKEDEPGATDVKRIWANLKIAQLELEYEKNKAEITRLGKQFSVVTQNTSLLVLDRVEDYLEHEIVPPAELQKEYYVLLKEKLKTKTDEKAEAFQAALTAITELKNWHNQTWQQVSINKMALTAEANASSRGSMQMSMPVNDSARMVESAENAANFSTTTATEEEEDVQVITNHLMAEAPAPPEMNEVKFTAPLHLLEEVKITKAAPALSTAIEVSQWKADADYLKELDKLPAAKYYEKYLSLKKNFASQPSFYVDVARYLFQKGNKQLALLVLSNVTEMKLEDPGLLRVVANQLMEFGETALALEVFEEVLSLREEEPQSYRDLALAYNENGNYQQAIDLLYKLALSPWDIRFQGIASIALNEMNAIISAHPRQVNIAGIEKKFIQPMPMDVRIVIGWSSNDSDLDLWVTDPAKEKCSYENNTTSAGGRISNDIIQGYGPEEFILKKAAAGNYVVEVNLYGDTRQTLGGPISIKAELFTNFGRPTQKRSIINCRVSSNKEVIKIGELKFVKGL